MAKAAEMRVVVEAGPAEAVTKLTRGLRELVDRNRDGDVEDVTLAVDGLLEEFGKVAQIETRTVGPRTWVLPAEPGPEVTHVRSERAIYDGFTLWERNSNGGWCLIRKDGAVLCIYGSWLKLLAAVGPLTDATGEQS